MNEITEHSRDDLSRDESTDKEDCLLVLGKASESTEGAWIGFFGDGGAGYWS